MVKMKKIWIYLFGVITVFISGLIVTYLMAFGVFQSGVSIKSGSDVWPILNANLLEGKQEIDILFLGTSLSHNTHWQQSVVEKISACSSKKIRIKTVAKPGASSNWGIIQFNSFFEQFSKKPDILFIEFSANDSSLFRGVSIKSSRENHERMIDLAHRYEVAVLLATMSPAFGQNGLERPGQSAYHQLYRAIAKEKSVGLIDTIEAWRDLQSERRRTYIEDGLHPSPEGMEKVSTPYITKAFKGIICEKVL